MRPVVHPDGSVLLVSADVLLDRNDALRLRILLFPDPQIKRSAIDIGNQVNLALMLGEGRSRRAPGESPGARAFVDGHTVILSERRIADRLIVRRRRPVAAEVAAGRSRERTRR